uniref:Uncharacterized protein n=1 Tax=Picea glauca TaxID=3330 RepID=A0A117NG78_PICGL|nr:hypothetical protein ABT39_MTgene1472 [Picea glauca]QHR90965.1 hypothetical protein Q903MT_gene4994 [Picea sitchensis]
MWVIISYQVSHAVITLLLLCLTYIYILPPSLCLIALYMFHFTRTCKHISLLVYTP